MIIGGFQPFTLSDFPGHVAAIVFTQGCNWRCPYCHNRSLLKTRRPEQELIPETHVFDILHRRRNELDGLVITGGEPTIQEDLPRFIHKVHRMGLAIKLDTNGSRPGVIGRLLEEGLLDYIAMDIKAPLDRYESVVGHPVDIGSIQTSIELVKNSGVPHEFRTPRI
ncbi:MAG: anaerobic ribonucleoside-triphosphate reductase activating protein [Candidatus Nealsonbacteria bacterium]|nr:anaerobic ribonucleoside-triphosphate reductase activating protein [Candidatus Nealsonbacteria bacterium]